MVALVEGGLVLAAEEVVEEIGLAAALPALADTVLKRATQKVGCVAGVVGPGSFTGLRAGLSVAAGVALGLGVPLVAVSVAEALADELGDLPGRTVWTAIEARRGFLFLDRGDGPQSCAVADIPAPRGAVAVCGNAANVVAATLAARGGDVMLTRARRPTARSVAAVALRREAGLLPPLPALPLYVEAPQAKLPAGGLRAPPV